MSAEKLVVIGGGATGAIVVIALAKALKEREMPVIPFILHLTDPNGFGCGGIAYGECSPQHILNTQRQEMSPWKPDGFAEFVQSLGRSTNKYTYDYRTDFKKYLDSELSTALDIIRSSGGTISIHTKSAFVSGSEAGFSIVDTEGGLLHEDLASLDASNIILAVGYGPNLNFQKLKQYVGSGYIHSLYPYQNVTSESALQKSNPRVAVFGSGAALYDFALSCPSKPEETELYVFSAAGVKAQEVRQVEHEHEFTEVPLHALTVLNTHSTVSDIETAIEAVFSESRSQKVGPDTWIAFCIMGTIGSVLRAVSDTVATSFRRSVYFSKLRRLGGPTSLPASQALEHFKTTFIASDIAPDQVTKLPDGSFKIAGERFEYIVDCIVNATGHGRHNSAILEDMKNHGLATIDPHTDVLATDATGYRLVGSGIACVGPATHFGTDGVQTFAKPAELAARKFISRLP